MGQAAIGRATNGCSNICRILLTRQHRDKAKANTSGRKWNTETSVVTSKMGRNKLVSGWDAQDRVKELSTVAFFIWQRSVVANGFRGKQTFETLERDTAHILYTEEYDRATLRMWSGME